MFDTQKAAKLISRYWQETQFWGTAQDLWTPEQILQRISEGGILQNYSTEAALYYGLIKCDKCESTEIVQLAIGMDENWTFIYRCNDHKESDVRRDYKDFPRLKKGVQDE